MATKSSGLGLFQIIMLILMWWSVFFFFLDLQLSVRVERIDSSTSIIESLRDAADKSFTVTDHDYVEEEDIFDEISNKE